MRALLLLGFILGITGGGAIVASIRQQPKASKVVLVIHGGLGLERKDLTPALETQYRAGLDEALVAAYAILKRKGTALDAVQEAVRLLEDNALFNAGKGAVFTIDGKNELDASIMSGKDKRAGAVAGLTTVKNPIFAARAVMDLSPHVFLIGRGAEKFAQEKGLEMVDPNYFRTEKRWLDYQRLLQEQKQGKRASRSSVHIDWGTVGAVALDAQGNLAAATSTGGMTGKRYGRVGDSPIIGAGTYADNAGAAVSATGHGEYFIRYGVAHEIVSLVKYKGLSPEKAAHQVVMETLKKAGGEGGVIVLDTQGRMAMPFNSEGMYRGFVTEEGERQTLLYEK